MPAKEAIDRGVKVLDRFGFPPTVPFTLINVIDVWSAVAFEAFHDSVGLGARHDLIDISLKNRHGFFDRSGMQRRRTLAIDLSRLRKRPQERV